MEARAHRIAVIDIHPGFIRTPMNAANKGSMPFLMDVDHAARLILRAIVRKKAVYDFPWQMALLMRFARILPPAIYDRIMSGRAPV